MTDAEDLPDGWAWTTLGEIGIWSGGGTPFKGNTAFWTGGSVPWVSPKDMKRPHIAESEDHVTTHAVETGEAKLLEPGSVLVVVRSGILQRTLPIAVTTARVTINQDLKALQPHAFVLPEFVASYLRCETQEILANCCKSGTTVANIELPRFWAFRFPLPPLAEQRRIVAKVEELTARSRAARAALAEVPTLLEQFRQSVLASAFRGDLTADWRAKNPTAEPASVLLDRIRAERRKQWEAKYPKKKYVAPEPVDDSELPELPEGWCWAALDNLAIHKSGVAYSSQDFVDEGVQVVKLGTLYQGRFDLTRDPAYLSPDHPEIGAGTVLPGDLLVSQTGTRFKRDYGHFVPVPEGCRPLALNQRVLAVTVAMNTIQKWVLFASRTEAYRDHLFASETGGVNQGNVGIEGVMRGPIPLAPIDEVLEITGIIERYIETSWNATRLAQTQIHELDQLDQSILAKAFRGELVPQDPDDEPASVLLERLRTSQAEANANGSGKRSRRRNSP